MGQDTVWLDHLTRMNGITSWQARRVLDSISRYVRPGSLGVFRGAFERTFAADGINPKDMMDFMDTYADHMQNIPGSETFNQLELSFRDYWNIAR